MKKKEADDDRSKAPWEADVGRTVERRRLWNGRLMEWWVYPPIEKILGPLMITRLSAAISIPLLSFYPYIAMLSGITLHLVVNCASILRNTLSVSLVTGLFILQNNAVPQSQRGAANGISMTAMSVFKAFGPAGGGALFSWAQKRQVAAFLPGVLTSSFATAFTSHYFGEKHQETCNLWLSYVHSVLHVFRILML
ncbi:hypothetical protein Ddye_020026 [Dipteronia dyeriana]|uniref:Uncharacterized protein n=1 Tax=Dipteronia dyeriana TaxID=168575 RepID=A0AAD9TZ07_9ROSI|nr:hypothetical protein Ddye_020026 [Dipteronia dyeriana]